MRFQHEFFAFLARLSISTVSGSDISLRRDSALYNWIYWQMSIYRTCLVPDNYVAILAMQPMANWLASALPVADAVSFEFDDISVTAQRARLLQSVHQRLSWWSSSGALMFLWEDIGVTPPTAKSWLSVVRCVCVKTECILCKMFYYK